jgi:hypothetical protein
VKRHCFYSLSISTATGSDSFSCRAVESSTKDIDSVYLLERGKCMAKLNADCQGGHCINLLLWEWNELNGVMQSTFQSLQNRLHNLLIAQCASAR